MRSILGWGTEVFNKICNKFFCTLLESNLTQSLDLRTLPSKVSVLLHQPLLQIGNNTVDEPSPDPTQAYF